jgi:predicted ATPase
LPETSNPLEQELVLLNLIAAPVMYTRGYAAAEARQVYERAHSLCEKVGESVHIFQALAGVASYRMVRGELDQSMLLAEKMLTRAQDQGETAAIVEAHRLVGLFSVWRGQFKKALPHLDQVRTLFDPLQREQHALTYGQDFRMSSCLLTANALIALGYPEQGRRWRLEGLAEAQKTGHHFSRAHARSFASITVQLLRDVEGVRDSAEDAIAFATDQRIPFWRTAAEFNHGWALAQEGNPDAAIIEFRKAFATWQAMGSKLGLPRLKTMYAEALAQKGQLGEALERIQEAVDQIERSGERWYEAEAYRVKGDLLVAGENRDRAGAELAYLKSIEVARRQEAKLFELRAATSLARLWHRHGGGRKLSSCSILSTANSRRASTKQTCEMPKPL